jgi:citrate synthase
MHRCISSMPHGTTQSLNHSSSPLRRVDCAARLQAAMPYIASYIASYIAGWRVLLSQECSSAKGC